MKYWGDAPVKVERIIRRKSLVEGNPPDTLKVWRWRHRYLPKDDWCPGDPAFQDTCAKAAVWTARFQRRGASLIAAAVAAWVIADDWAAAQEKEVP